MNYMRMWDVTSSSRVDYFIANSQNVAKKIQKYYRRDSTVITPPVDTNFFIPGTIDEEYFLKCLEVNKLNKNLFKFEDFKSSCFDTETELENINKRYKILK